MQNQREPKTVRRLPYRRKGERSPPLPWTDCNVKSERQRDRDGGAWEDGAGLHFRSIDL